MIKQISLKNFVLFEEQIIKFGENSNGLVGETGAGKSVVLLAINVLCGQRNLKKLIMKDTNYYELQMLISLNKIIPTTLNKLNEILNLELTSQSELKIYRKLDLNSKSIITINEKNYTLVELKNVMDLIIDIHMQDATNEILKEDNHINIIDELIDEKLILNYKEIYSEYEKKVKLVKELNIIDQTKEEKLEMLNFKLSQLKEIQSIESEEILLKQKEEVDQKQKNIKNNEIIQSSLNKIYKELEVVKNNSDLAQIEGFELKISNMYYEVEDLLFEHSKSMDAQDDIDIDKVVESLDLLKRLQRKYNLDYEGLISKYKELTDQKEKIQNISFEIIKEEKNLKIIQEKLFKSANELSNKRKEISSSLIKKVNENFVDLQMPNAQIKVNIKECNPSSNGIDDIQILIKTNKGHDFEPIDQIASGGEKSRVMLILKIVFNEYKPKLIYLLDEIDQGISSQVAKKVGEKIQKFSQNNQLIVISHSVQVINMLDTLIEVSKYDTDNITKSKALLLQPEQRKEFINKYLEI